MNVEIIKIVWDIETFKVGTVNYSPLKGEVLTPTYKKTIIKCDRAYPKDGALIIETDLMNGDTKIDCFSLSSIASWSFVRKNVKAKELI